MASPPSFRISPETLSGPTDLFFPIAAGKFRGANSGLGMYGVARQLGK